MPKKRQNVRAKRTERIPPNVGARMRAWREAAGLSLEAVADKIGTGKGHLSDAETGKGNLSLPLFIEFCDAIKTPSSRILGDRMLPKNRDFERTARELRDTLGNNAINWLAELSKEEARFAVARAREAVDLYRLRHPNKKAKAAAPTIVPLAAATDEESSVPERAR